MPRSEETPEEILEQIKSILSQSCKMLTYLEKGLRVGFHGMPGAIKAYAGTERGPNPFMIPGKGPGPMVTTKMTSCGPSLISAMYPERKGEAYYAVYQHGRGIDVIPFIMEDPTEPTPEFINDPCVDSAYANEFISAIGIDNFEPEKDERIDFIRMSCGEVPVISSRAPYILWNSLDGIMAHHDEFQTYGEAVKARDAYLERFRQIGYYNDHRQRRIPAEQLHKYIHIIPESVLFPEDNSDDDEKDGQE